MKRLALLFATLAVPAAAAELPPGLVSAELLPVALAEDGRLMTALHLELEPGWKTYWRSPGETGVPPQFDWSAVTNLTSATPHWPAPELIESDGTTTLGYHDTLILPIELVPTDAKQPVAGKVTMDLGLCLNICVPAHIELAAPVAASNLDSRIADALANAPQKGSEDVTCSVSEIKDGLRVTASVKAAPAQAAALELDSPGMWISQPELVHSGDRLTATAEFVDPSGKPFPLEHKALRLTLIGDGEAVEYQGCTPA